METVFRVSNCREECRVKYATCTLNGAALTWWNNHVQGLGIDEAYQIPWLTLKQMMMDEYCPRSEIQKMEEELYNLKVQGSDIVSYTTRFHELAQLCPTMVTPEYKRIEQYLKGLPPSIEDMVTSSMPDIIQSAIRLAHRLIDQAVSRGTLGTKVSRSLPGTLG
ncbi:hypothetical protein E3N88_07011 [Mikania micrantha]|uniref:Retrotransposon gag domain-containing protein n=1 Tax=Mikania micrantha TaxID=192012 RepID=A0A5N6PSE4_9ASTR|nr:hypothetical protein E3N88_07011 [Mikania micrantha]